jgi:rod shape-determining protein MreD
MTDLADSPLWLIAGTVLLALLLSVVPLPGPLALYRPEWLALVVIYWCLTSPERFGPGAAWTCGIVMDALHGTLLGENALALLLLSFFALRFRLQVRVFPILQQSLTVALLLALHTFILIWIDGVSDVAIGGVTRLWPVLVSALAWPLVVLGLDRVRERSGNGARVPG